jgi:hypothetical protein
MFLWPPDVDGSACATRALSTSYPTLPSYADGLSTLFPKSVMVRTFTLVALRCPGFFLLGLNRGGYFFSSSRFHLSICFPLILSSRPNFLGWGFMAFSFHIYNVAYCFHKKESYSLGGCNGSGVVYPEQCHDIYTSGSCNYQYAHTTIWTICASPSWMGRALASTTQEHKR